VACRERPKWRSFCDQDFGDRTFVASSKNLALLGNPRDWNLDSPRLGTEQAAEKGNHSVLNAREANREG
jgi:hypothetical protein